MNTTKQALTIAGFDSGGGAGMQADLKVFQERQIFGTCVLTALPIQNTCGVQKVYDLPLEAIKDQLAVIAEDFDIDVTKIGMLFSKEIIQLVSDFLKTVDFGPIVLDPVMVAKSGHALLKESAIQTLKEELLPLVTIVTPNIPEAEILANMSIQTKEDMVLAGQKIQQLGVKHVIVKGGHHIEGDLSEDVLVLDNQESYWLKNKRIDTKNTHGTGCTFSACMAAELGKGKSVLESVQIAKEYIQAAISDGIDVGHGHGPTNHWAYRKVEAMKDGKE